MHGVRRAGRVAVLSVACSVMTLMGCGQFGRKVAADVGTAITPDENGAVRDVLAASRGSARVRPGITVLMTDSIGLIRNRRVGLLTNHTGINERGESDIELLR